MKDLKSSFGMMVREVERKPESSMAAAFKLNQTPQKTCLREILKKLNSEV